MRSRWPFLRFRRADSLVDDPELHPPDIEFAEPVNSPGSKWGAVVCPDCIRKPVLAKQGPEGGFRAFCANRRQTLAEQEHSTVVIRNGERVAVLPVAGLELTLEVRRPDLIGPRRLERNRSGMIPRPPPSDLAKLAVSIQQLVDGTPGRNSPTRMSSPEDLAKLRRPPAILLSKRQELALDVFGRSPGRR
jgi:hypothetical protein